MKLPTVEQIALALGPVKVEATRVRAAASAIEKPDPTTWHIPVHVQIPDRGRWRLHTGKERTWEDDHEGWWGSEYVDHKSDLKVVAASILEELNDQMYIHGEVQRA